LGQGGALGLIITGHAYVAPEGRMRKGQISVVSDDVIPGLASVAEAASAEGSRIFLQLSHGGVCSDPAETGLPCSGPSDDVDGPGKGGRAMGLEEVQALPSLFAAAARRAQKAGFHGVQLHMAHGFLLNQFLSPFFNRREDAYGGSQEKRARIALEVLEAVRTACGKDFPVIAKLSGDDLDARGLNPELALLSARMLQEAGLDGIEISGGFCFRTDPTLTPSRPPFRDAQGNTAYFRELAARFHKELDIPVIMVGGIRTKEQAEAILHNNEASLVSVCRPLIRRPELALLWKKGGNEASACISCNQCLQRSRAAEGVSCPFRGKDRG